jgi:hypothetical protein
MSARNSFPAAILQATPLNPGICPQNPKGAPHPLPFSTTFHMISSPKKPGLPELISLIPLSHQKN